MAWGWQAHGTGKRTVQFLQRHLLHLPVVATFAAAGWKSSDNLHAHTQSQDLSIIAMLCLHYLEQAYVV